MSGSVPPMLAPAPVMQSAQPIGGGIGQSPLAAAIMGRMGGGAQQPSNPLGGIPLASLMAALQPGQPSPGTVAGNAPVMGASGISPSALSAIQSNASSFGPAIGAGGGLGPVY